MIYITGDTHGSIDVKKLNTKNFPEQKRLTKQDYVIICGDFGNVWYPPESEGHKEDAYWLKWFNNKPFTTLFIDGNHEGFPTLNSYPVVDFCGGEAGKIASSIYHLKRGEIYNIDEYSFFCFGGAQSHDKAYRKEGVSWWPEEMPTVKEMDRGIENLEKVQYTVDFIITHCCSSTILKNVFPYSETDSLTQFFKFIEDNTVFKHWFFGHYHQDINIDDKHSCVYQNIVKI